MRLSALLLVPLVAVALALGACDADDGDATATPTPPASEPTPGSTGAPVTPNGGGSAMGPGVSIADALESDVDEPLLVNGYLVATSGEVMLCEMLAESYPPQCGGARIAVSGLDLAAIAGLQSAQGVQWTDRPVQVLGEVVDGELRASADSSA